MTTPTKYLPVLQPHLENDLVVLRPLAAQDFDALYQVAKDPLIWEQHPKKRHILEEYTLFFNDSLASSGALIIHEVNSGQVIGSSRFKKVMSHDTAVEIGWTFLARMYWGGKYNASIKSLMINYAFKYFDDIIFFVSKENFRSQRAVEKIGGILTTEKNFQSTSIDNDLTYRIKKNDWSHKK